jgi:hypothetical protein
MSFILRLFSIFVLIITFFLQPKLSFASEPISSWSSATPLPYLLASHVSFLYQNKLFVNAGSAQTGDDKYDTISSIVNADGTLNLWHSDSVLLPEGLIFHTLATKNNRVYILGGLEENPGSAHSSVPTVYLGLINASGIIDSWNTLTPLPTASHLGGAVVINDRLYYAHGTTVLKSSINPADGTIGAWTSAGTLPTFLSGFGLIEYNNHLILVGGRFQGGPDSEKVYTSTINPDGTISVWTETQSLPQAVNRGGVVKVGTTLFSIGGANNGSYLNKVYYTNINNDGTVEPWQTSSHNLPQAVCCAGVAASDKYIYITGGYGGSYLDGVYYAKIGGEPILPVPLLKQTAEPWQSQEYDTAHLWSPSNPTINRWGCAMTSAAMIFKYYGINKLPDGTNLDPGTLNAWLKNYKDGYVRGGLLNWLALSRLSKLAKNINGITTFDALEYDKKNGANKSQLTTDIANGIPGILEVTNHFVVANGIDGETFKINDPFYNRETLNDGYSNTFLSLSRFVPSNTDLSYIMIVADANVSLRLLDINGNEISKSFIQQPLVDPTAPQNKSEAVSMLYAQKPPSGNYKVVAQGSGSISKITFYQYDTEGNVTMSDQQILKTTNFNVNYNKNNSANKEPEKIVSFQTVMDDIKALDKDKQINHPLAVGIINLINQSEREYNKKNKKNALKLMDLAEKLLKASPKILTKEQAYKLLLTDFSALKNLIRS